MRGGLTLAMVAVLLAAGPGFAGTVCRPDQLGTVSCPVVVRPAPRPPFDKPPVQALDRIREARPRAQPETFVPARRTRGLGGDLPDLDAVGPCRTDQLGNLHCR